METIINFSSKNIQENLHQVVDFVRELPEKERAMLKIALDIIEDEAIMDNSELKSKIKEGLQDAKLHREGKIKLRTLTEFLADV